MDSRHGKIRKNVEGDDRLSNLPDDLIHKILSFNSTKEAIQTSALSSRWRHTWTSIPCLNLDSNSFRTLNHFSKFVKDVLANRNTQIEVSSVKLEFRGKLLSSSGEVLAQQPSPFANLKSLKIYSYHGPYELIRQLRESGKKQTQRGVTISTEVRNYLLNSSPGATFTVVSHEQRRAVENATSATVFNQTTDWMRIQSGSKFLEPAASSQPSS